MNEDELRTIVREAVARHLAPAPGAESRNPGIASRHASHFLLPVHSGSEGEGRCLIEPAVMCNHCGYCQSYGH